MMLRPGDTLDRYSIIALLGSGGMGEVYRAYDRRLQRTVALKVLHRDGEDSREERAERARILREARAAAALDSKNVVAVYDADEAASPEALRGTPYLAMELVEGKPLRAYVGDSTTSMETKLAWLGDVARALAIAHRAGLIHRDIKPANIIVRNDGVVKVLDFGIAKRLVARVDPTAPTEAPLSATFGQAAGTPAYMAPEHLRGDAVDGRADQFSWGVMAYELLAGKRPWVSGDGAVHLLAEILTREPQPIEQATPSVPPYAAAVIRRAMAKAPDARFATMDDLASALDDGARRARSKGNDSRRRIVLELGQGGMGTVFLAVHRGPGGFSKLKVLKYLNPEYASDPALVTMFLEEARLAARLSHPNIVQTNEAGLEDGRYFIEMEYLEGQSYRALRRSGRVVPLPVAVWVLTRVLRALHYAHELRDASGAPLRIVHRDATPDNVMLTYEGEVKLVDFGIAKAADSRNRTGTGVLKGKLTYVAPEQIESGGVDRRADVFAVGAMLWEALAGRRLWEGLATERIITELQGHRIPNVADVAPAAPPVLLDACLRALAPRPGDRYATAAAFEEVLEGYLEMEGSRADAKRLRDLLASAFPGAREARQRQIDALLLDATNETAPEGPAVPALPASPPPGSAPPETRAEGRGRATPTATTSSFDVSGSTEGATLRAGDRVERYVIEGPLGAGGMGEVYRAYDSRLRRAIALKILRPDEPLAKGRVSQPETNPGVRMLREAQLAASLDHPNVVAIFDVGQLSEPVALRGTTYIAMELIRGEPLRKYIGDNSVKPGQRIRWLEEIARALGAAHAAGLVHRDVKPENVMIREDGIAKVLDFGVAKRTVAPAVHPTSSTEGYEVPTMTEQGVVVGTPMYMAPEQLRAEPLDGRADQFAWGVVAYELLTGKALWSLEGGGFSLVAQILQAPAPSLEGVAGVTARVAETVARALSKDPVARFPTMTALVEGLTGKSVTDDAEQQIPVRTSSPELDRQRFSGAPKVGDASAPLLLPSSTKRSVVDEQRNAITKRSDRPPPPATRPRFAFAGAASVVAIGALVAGVAWRGHRVGANATSAPSAVTPPPGCTSNHACVQAHGGEPWMCRASDKQCVAIDSTDCHARADEGALNSDETFWIGEMYALGQPEGQGNDRGTELARQDFAQLANALRTNERHARPLALVACDDGTDPRRAARHLVDDLHVPAIVGFSSGSELLDLATSVLAPNDVLAIATLTSSPLVTQLPRPPGAPPLVWRTTYGLSEVALAASTVIATTLEPEVHSAGASHVRIALLRTQSAAAQVLADRFFDALRFNGQSALDNGSDYRDVVVDTKDASTYASAIVQLLDLRPQIVLYFGGEPLTENVIVPVEKAWPASERVRPRYLAASVFDPQALHVAERNASTRHRFFGLTSLSGTPVNARFAMHFNQVFGTDASRADVPSTAYDAFYVVAYASFALGRRDISGTNLARAMSRLVTPGSTIDVGPSGILQAFTTLTTEGQSIDLNGAGGTLDFDLESGEHEADLAVLCVNVDKAGRATGDIESGLVYRARAKVLTGRMRCP